MTIVSSSGAQVLEWERQVTSTYGSVDLLYSLRWLASNHLLVAGTASDALNSDFMTVRYEASGTRSWTARYPVPNDPDSDYAHHVTVDENGDIYVVGMTITSGFTVHSVRLVKYDASGNLLWATSYNTGPGYHDHGHGIRFDSTGNVYVLGNTLGPGADGRFLALKYTSAGILVWARHWGDAASANYPNDMVVDAAGNSYLTGQVGATADVGTIKYDSNGALQWSRVLNGAGNRSDAGCAIALHAGGVVVTATVATSRENTDIATIKYSAVGVQDWIAYYDSPAHRLDAPSPRALATDPAGNVYVTGQTDFHPQTNQPSDGVTLKYDSAGALQWASLYDGQLHGWDRGRAIAVDEVGSVLVAGDLTGQGIDVFVVKYDSSGQEVFEDRRSSTGNLVDEPNAIVTGRPGEFFVAAIFGVNSDRNMAVWKYSTSSPPEILSPPQSITCCVAQTATFQVTHDGTPPITYQWRHNGAEISGATEQTYVITHAAAQHGGQYDVRVSNGFGSVVSVAAQLTIDTTNACDVNCDGSVNPFDIEPFIAILSGLGTSCEACTADVNGDGSVNAFDINGFVECLNAP